MQTRRALLRASLAIGGVAVVALSGRGALASIEQEASDFITDLGNRAIAQLTDTSVSEQERVDRFRALLIEAVDFSLISQQVLGTYWRSTEEAVRAEFNEVLRETLIQRFLPLFDSYEGETFDVSSTRTSTRDPSVVAATTNVVAPNGSIAKVEWYMRKENEALKIYDFSAEGIRLTVSLQEEYSTVLRRNDGDVTVLIAQMKNKLPATARLD